MTEDPTSRAGLFVFRYPLLSLILFGLIYGYRAVDLVEWRVITASPFVVLLEPDQQYRYASPFAPILGAYYQHQGLRYEDAFVAVYGLGFALALFAAHQALKRQAGRDHWRTMAAVACASPLPFVALTWIGKSDLFLIGFYLLLMVTDSRLMQFILSVLMLTCHQELGTAMLVAHILLGGRHRGAIILGIATGLLGLYVYTHTCLSQVPASRLQYSLDHLPELVRMFVSHPLLYVAAALGPFWLYMLRRSTLDLARLSILAMALALAVASFDFTRIFAIVCVPLILAVSKEAGEEISRIGAARIAGFGVPAKWLWVPIFLQLQIAGAHVILARGLQIGLAP